MLLTAEFLVSGEKVPIELSKNTINELGRFFLNMLFIDYSFQFGCKESV